MDNYFKQCPPMMSDGRFLTDWRTDVRMNEYVKYINNITRDDEYRMFLENNGEAILDAQWDNLRKTKSCWANECVHNYPTRMYPGWFAEERRAYNSLANRTNKVTKYPCPPFRDYRLTETRGMKS